MRAIICSTLEAAGVSDTVQTADGGQALELFREGGIDLVVTD
jgi:CheY-like chemotaxis protein